MRGWRLLGALAFVVAAAGSATTACSAEPKADVSDLGAFDEIELGDLAGTDALMGQTRSEFLPIVVEREGAGETSLSIVDAHTGRVTDAGPIPVKGWATNGYPRASDRFVALQVDVCEEQPYEGDAGKECGDAPTGAQPPSELVVYDMVEERWSSLRLDQPVGTWMTLADVDGSNAILTRAREREDEPDLWSAMDLRKPLEVGSFGEEGAPRANGLADSRGHYDGWGWKASGVGGADDGDTYWYGTRDGQAVTETISNRPDRRYAGAGRCLVVASHRPHDLERLDRMHRLCTD